MIDSFSLQVGQVRIYIGERLLGKEKEPNKKTFIPRGMPCLTFFFFSFIFDRQC